jgi:hypothetical protein
VAVLVAVRVPESSFRTASNWCSGERCAYRRVHGRALVPEELLDRSKRHAGHHRVDMDENHNRQRVPATGTSSREADCASASDETRPSGSVARLPAERHCLPLVTGARYGRTLPGGARVIHPPCEIIVGAVMAQTMADVSL